MRCLHEHDYEPNKAFESFEKQIKLNRADSKSREELVNVDLELGNQKQHWSRDEQLLFAEAFQKVGKDFQQIKLQFVSFVSKNIFQFKKNVSLIFVNK